MNNAEVAATAVQDDIVERAWLPRRRDFSWGEPATLLTHTALTLRADHAAARDAVYAELDLIANFGRERIDRFQLFDTHTEARTKAEYLMRPDRGRRLATESRRQIVERCPPNVDLQVVIGDGLSASAVAAQAPDCWTYCGKRPRAQLALWQAVRGKALSRRRAQRIGELINPRIAVLLIGERPGLAAADSLSAYLAFRPRPGHSDANRNLISNIHSRGVDTEQAVRRIISLAVILCVLERSGVDVKEDLSSGISSAGGASAIG